MPSDENPPSPGASDEDTIPPLAPKEVERLKLLDTLHSTPLSDFTTEISVTSATDLFLRFQGSPLSDQGWGFRGHSDTVWNLEPLLDRLTKKYKNTIRSEPEKYALETFKRRAHHYLPNVPDEQDDLEWLALMRHHGAPTRLLDWTTSPYVAAFFAAAEAQQDQLFAIWAIDLRTIKWEATKLLAESGVLSFGSDADQWRFSFSDREGFRTVFMRDTNPAIVAPVQPFRTNERVTSQQGLFLCSNSRLFGFELGLKQILWSDREWQVQEFGPDGGNPDRLFKIVVVPDARTEVLRELHRMNINYATLFPGLDGFSRSLTTNITISEPFLFLRGSEDVDFRI